MKKIKHPTRVCVEKGESTLKRILRYVGRYPVSLIGSLIFAAVSVAATLFVPVLFGDAVDCIVESGVLWSDLQAIFLKIIIAVVVAALAQWLTSLCNNRISCHVVRDIRADAFAKRLAIHHFGIRLNLLEN